MLKSSIKFNEAFEENVRKIYARVTIGDKSFTEADIFTIDFESGSVNGPGYQIGSVFSDLVKIKFDKVIRDLKELDKVIVEIGIEREQIEVSKLPTYNSKVKSMRVGRGKLNKIFYDNPIEYVRLGTFYISEHADINENDQTTTISCMDAIIYFEQQYKPSIKFPADILDVSVDIANQIGIQINAQTFIQLPKKKINLPEPMTARQLIGYIAQFSCGFIKVSKYGILELKTPKNTERIIDSSLYYQKGLSKNDLKYRIDGILNRNQITSKELVSGKNNGSQLIIENPFIEQRDLDEIFKIVKGVEYYPFTLQWYGIPSIEAGDWLIVKDVEGNNFRVPNLSYKLHYNGGLKAISTAETQSQSSDLKIFQSPLDREMTRLNREIVSTKESSITKEDIIEKINISEETLEGKPLQISGNKITINNYTSIEDGSIKNEAIESVEADKLFGETKNNNMYINFDDGVLRSESSLQNEVAISKGNVEFKNASDLIIKTKSDAIMKQSAIKEEELSKFILESVVVSTMFKNEDKEYLRFNQDILSKMDSNSAEREESLINVVMSMIVTIQKLNKEIEKLKVDRGD